MLYRKKPVVVEAVKWDGENDEEVKAFCGSLGNPVIRQARGKLVHCLEPKPLPNADKIRAMSDEELADQFTKNGVFLCPAHNPNCLEADCRQCFLDWLKQEATDGNSR